LKNPLIFVGNQPHAAGTVTSSTRQNWKADVHQSSPRENTLPEQRPYSQLVQSEKNIQDEIRGSTISISSSFMHSFPLEKIEQMFQKHYPR